MLKEKYTAFHLSVLSHLPKLLWHELAQFKHLPAKVWPWGRWGTPRPSVGRCTGAAWGCGAAPRLLRQQTQHTLSCTALTWPCKPLGHRNTLRVHK